MAKVPGTPNKVTVSQLKMTKPEAARLGGLANRAQKNEFAAEVVFKILERIADGETLARITLEKGMPSRRAFHKWVSQNTELQKAYAAAREVSASSLEEKALGMVDDMIDNIDIISAPQVAAFNAAMNQLRWSASRRSPAEYGDKQTVNIRVPIQINTSLNLGEGEDGTEKTLDSTFTVPDVYTIEAKPLLEFQPNEENRRDRPDPNRRSLRNPSTKRRAVTKAKPKEEPVRSDSPGGRDGEEGDS